MTIYDPSDKVPLRVQVLNAAGALTDTTSVTYTVTAPNGTAGTPIVVNTSTTTGLYDADIDITASPYSGQAGQYVWRAIAAGAITGEFDGWFVVRARRSAGPVWTPELDAVADWIPARTLSSILTPGVESYLGTFTATTTPTDEQARRHVDAAVAYVTGRCGGSNGTIDATLYDEARAAASIRAAAAIELAYPTRDADLTTYDRLNAQAEDMIANLASNNVQATGQGASLEQSLMPQWQFPTAPPWGDQIIL